MRKIYVLCLFLVAACSSSNKRSSNDPYAWTEEIEGSRALTWAKAENERTLAPLKSDPRFSEMKAEALKILQSKDRIPNVSFSNNYVYNFWRDAQNVRGLWRRTSLSSFRTATPEWETVLDIDALAKVENKNWVYEGVDCLVPEERLCLISLSDGGKDAHVVREFDTATKQFVADGFVVPEAKNTAYFLDRDRIIVGHDWGQGSLTKSGYPYISKLWRRSEPLSKAQTIFKGSDNDTWAYTQVLRDHKGDIRLMIGVRGVSFFEKKYLVYHGNTGHRWPLPAKSQIEGFVQEHVIFSLQQDWPEKNLKSGDVASISIVSLRKDPSSTDAQLVLRPTKSQSIEQVSITRNKMVVAMLDDVEGKVITLTKTKNGWNQRRLALPKGLSFQIESTSDTSDLISILGSGYLNPVGLWFADANSGKVSKIKTLPAQFESKGLVVDKHHVASKDGTKVPYFVVRKKNLKFDGSAPTLLYAYGGFQNSLPPMYSALRGKLWLEKGGVFVLANIRGGGEYGPAWHQAGLKENRQKVFDDFFAVSEDLIKRKVTSSRRLGAMGGSNGGLLMGVALTQRPELYKALVIQVPLFDMLNYTHLGAGASWIGEYGDPAIPEERAYIAAYDPYSNLKASQPYPKVFIETSTKDDRVHPAHARKAAARLKELGYDYYYHENMDGGHSAAANLEEKAIQQALSYTYLMQELMD